MGESYLRVLIVDDEYMVRGLLKRCINWNEIGMEIAGEASCAQEALELMDRLNPDIIYTDIYMPYMDGIEFSRLALEKRPDVKIVILTGYEEFEYAKRSVKLGISDFLLKPINDDEIRKSALSVKDKINSERIRLDEYKRMKMLLEENRPYLKEKFLNELLYADMPADEMSEKQAYFGLDFGSGIFQVALLEVEMPNKSAIPGPEEKYLLRMQCMEAAKQHFENSPLITVFFDNAQKLAILNTSSGIDFIECCETLRIMLAGKIKCIASIGIGTPCKGSKNIRQTYREALYALNYAAVLGKNQVISYSDIDISQKKPLYQKNKLHEEFEFCIKACLADKAEELFSASCKGIDPDSGDAAVALWVVASNLISVILSVINETGLEISDVFKDGGEPFKQVFRICTLPEMEDYMSSIIRRTINLIEKLKTKKVNKTIGDIKEYIDENISSPALSLSSVAGKFYLNPSYLSRIFKQETGQTLSEYIAKARMELAVRLLSQTDMKAYEIAERVGIQDPHYFSICFKKYTGMSVIDYRKLSSKL